MKTPQYLFTNLAIIGLLLLAAGLGTKLPSYGNYLAALGLLLALVFGLVSWTRERHHKLWTGIAALLLVALVLATLIGIGYIIWLLWRQFVG